MTTAAAAGAVLIAEAGRWPPLTEPATSQKPPAGQGVGLAILPFSEQPRRRGRPGRPWPYPKRPAAGEPPPPGGRPTQKGLVSLSLARSSTFTFFFFPLFFVCFAVVVVVVCVCVSLSLSLSLGPTNHDEVAPRASNWFVVVSLLLVFFYVVDLVFVFPFV